MLTRLRNVTVLLLSGSLALFVASGVVSDTLVDRLRKEQQADALATMNQAAGNAAIAAQVMFGGLAELSRLASLAVRLDGDPGYKITVEALLAAMAANALDVSAVQVRDLHGAVVLSAGRLTSDAPVETNQARLGRPWISSDGKWLQLYKTTLDAHPGWTMSATISPTAVSAALQRALPRNNAAKTPAITTLVRLSDGVFVARSDTIEKIRNDRPELRRHVADMEHTDSGAVRLISVITGVDTVVGYRTMPELDLAATVGVSAEDVIPMSDLSTRQLRRAPYVVLFFCLASSAIALALLIRRRAAATVLSERHKADAEAAARAELDLLVRCSPAMLYRGQLDPQGVYTRDYVTPNSKAVTGWEPEMLSDPERVWKLSAQEDRHLRGSNYARALKLGRSAMDYRFLRPDGGYSWLRNEAVIVTRRPDGSAEVVGAITNITRERELAAQAALQSRMATLGQLSTSLAHELTQPVTVIGMSAAIAQSIVGQRSVETPRELIAQIDQILDQTDRAADMIRHLRSYGHTDSGPLAEVDLARAVVGAMSLAGAPLREAGVTVHVAMQPNLPPVRARLVQVEQVLVNLMINARDAMQAVPDTSRQLTLTALEGETVRLSVADSGPGIPDDVMPRLFEAFYTTKAPGHGTGLGLALCRSMMQSFGGEIVVDSCATGATFTLEFQAAT